MFYRRKIILALLQQLGGEVASTDFQKYLFLFSQHQSEPAFDFVPYRFGCFSFQSYSDRSHLEKSGFLEEHESSDKYWKLKSNKNFVQELTSTDQRILNEFVSQHSSLKGKNLISFVYKKHPFYAINSVIADKYLNASELKAVKAAKPNLQAPQLFSIGYEGKSIDRYLCQLIENGVQLLCDVRKNPLSRKYGFSKTQLKKCVESLGIEYRHLPQLGIESPDRQSLCCFRDYQKLFGRYEKTTLKKEQAAIDEIVKFVGKHSRVAITCFEANHEWCHRSRVASALEQHEGYDQSVAHL